jgi:hypothetical protein
MASICVGEEFTTDAQGKLKLVIDGNPADLAWPYPCAVGAFNSLKRTPSGGLWAPPVPVAAAQDAFGTSHSGINTPVPVAFTTVDTMTISLTNPSTCMSAKVLRFLSVDVDLTYPPGADSQATIRVSGNEMFTTENPAPASGTSMSTHVETVLPQLFSTLAPGQTLAFNTLIEVGEGAGGTTYGEIRWAIRAFMLALP